MISSEILHQLSYEHSRALQAQAAGAGQGRRQRPAPPSPDRRTLPRWLRRPAPARS